MALTDLINIFNQYRDASATNPPPQTEQHYAQVAQQAPPDALAGGLSEAFRSNQTPPFSQMVSTLFNNSNGEQRAGILNQLISAIPAGALSAWPGLSREGRPSVGSAQANQISPQTVREMAERAEQHDPSIVDRASNFYAQHPTLIQALGAGSLALIMSNLSRR